MKSTTAENISYLLLFLFFLGIVKFQELVRIIEWVLTQGSSR